MDFYTLKGRNANKFFSLELEPSKYYNWAEVKELAKKKRDELYSKTDEDQMTENIERFQEIIDARKRRELKIRSRFNDYKIQFIPNSFYVRNHIMYGKKTTEEVLRKMYMMKILFENCDIKNKWEKNKVTKGQQIYTFEEKDLFYETTYTEFMRENPRLKYF